VRTDVASLARDRFGAVVPVIPASVKIPIGRTPPIEMGALKALKAFALWL
jgi:hypothetical protein